MTQFGKIVLFIQGDALRQRLKKSLDCLRINGAEDLEAILPQLIKDLQKCGSLVGVLGPATTG
jgi:hypothetical protein